MIPFKEMNLLLQIHEIIKINHPMYKDDIKVFVENEKEMETLKQAIRIFNQDKDGIWHWKEWYADMKKEEKRMLGERENYMYWRT